MDLVELLKTPEGKTLEFKRELSSPDGVLKTLVFFANTAGGTLLLGVEDRTGHVRGVAEPLDLEERIASLISDRISPRLLPEIEILPWRRTQVLAVQVHPSPSRPHHLTREGVERGVYVGLRTGAHRALPGRLDPGGALRGPGPEPDRGSRRDPLSARAGDRGGGRLRRQACPSRSRDRGGPAPGELEPAARGRARGDDQRRGAR